MKSIYRNGRQLTKSEQNASILCCSMGCKSNVTHCEYVGCSSFYYCDACWEKPGPYGDTPKQRALTDTTQNENSKMETSQATFKTDGATRRAKAEDIRVGTMLRMAAYGGNTAPFADTLVLGITTEDAQDRACPHDSVAAAQNFGFTHDITVHLARPYAYTSTIGTCFDVLMGVERYTTTAKSILERYDVVLMSTGKVANYAQ